MCAASGSLRQRSVHANTVRVGHLRRAASSRMATTQLVQARGWLRACFACAGCTLCCVAHSSPKSKWGTVPCNYARDYFYRPETAKQLRISLHAPQRHAEELRHVHGSAWQHRHGGSCHDDVDGSPCHPARAANRRTVCVSARRHSGGHSSGGHRWCRCSRGSCRCPHGRCSAGSAAGSACCAHGRAARCRRCARHHLPDSRRRRCTRCCCHPCHCRYNTRRRSCACHLRRGSRRRPWCCRRHSTCSRSAPAAPTAQRATRRTSPTDVAATGQRRATDLRHAAIRSRCLWQCQSPAPRAGDDAAAALAAACAHAAVSRLRHSAVRDAQTIRCSCRGR